MDKISITLSPGTVSDVDAREVRGKTNRSGVIDRDLTRYYEALRLSRRHLRYEVFTEDEIGAILDNLNGVWLNEPMGVRSIPLNLIDGMADLTAKWKLDGERFAFKVNNLTFTELCALADMAERYWAACRAATSGGFQPDYKDALE